MTDELGNSFNIPAGCPMCLLLNFDAMSNTSMLSFLEN